MACDLDQLVERLTPRRREILALAAKGLSNAEIGGALGISPATVRTQMTTIFAELGVANRTEATASFLSAQAAPGRIDAIIGRPGIALLPLEHANDTAEARLLARGLTADLGSLLARCCWFPVIDPTALLSAAATDGSGDRSASAIAKRLGARFLVQGLLRSSGDGFLLVVRVDEAESGRCIWTGRFPFASGEPFEVEYAICEQIVALAYPVLVAHVSMAPRDAPPATFDAWTLAHEGMAHQARRDPKSSVAARRCFAAALAEDPTLVLAHFGLGLTAYDAVLNQWSDKTDAMVLLAQSVDACLRLAPHASEGHFLEARLLQAFGQPTRAILPLERAIASNPSFGSAHALLAQILCMADRADEGLTQMEHAARLSPQGFVAGLAVVHFLRQEYGVALGYAEEAIARKPSYAFARMMGAVSAWWLGDHARARTLAAPLGAAPHPFAAHSFAATFGTATDGVARVTQALSALA